MLMLTASYFAAMLPKIVDSERLNNCQKISGKCDMISTHCNIYLKMSRKIPEIDLEAMSNDFFWKYACLPFYPV